MAADIVDYLGTHVKGVNKDLWQSIWSFVRAPPISDPRSHMQSREIKLNADQQLIGFDETAACTSPLGPSALIRPGPSELDAYAAWVGRYVDPCLCEADGSQRALRSDGRRVVPIASPSPTLSL